MSTIQDPFQLACVHAQAGRLRQAADLCHQILATNPRHAHAMHLLASIFLHSGQVDQAINLAQRAIAVAPAEASFHATLGQALGACGRFAEAKRSLTTAIELAPHSPGLFLALAMAHRALDDWEEARDACRRALALDAKLHAAENLLGDVLRHLGDRAGAQDAFERALAINPNDFDAVINLATMAQHDGDEARAMRYFERASELAPDVAQIHYYLGELEFARHQYLAAQQRFERSLALDANSALAEAKLAAALHAQLRRDEAVPHYQRAIALKPDFADAHFHLALAIDELGREGEALEHYRRTLEIEPDHERAHMHLGAVFQRRGEMRTALEHFERALAAAPQAETLNSATSHYNRAVVLLLLGRFAEAWDDFEWRAKLKDFPMRAVDRPMWDGSPAMGKTLLVHSEQGLGDTLQFVRYSPIVRRRCGRVILQVQRQLLPLLAASGFEGLVSADDPTPECDIHVPLLSLPHLVGTTVENIPADIPYLFARPDLVEEWGKEAGGKARGQRLEAREGTVGSSSSSLSPLASGLCVGICWQGSKTNRADATRSIPLAAFAPLARIDGVTLVSLQKQPGATDRFETGSNASVGATAGFALHELSAGWDEAAGPFMDTAAVMKHLDLVITADTATAHLAGALSVPVWVALSATPDWRWMLEREDSPWYPTMRLFRQARQGDWSELFERIATALARLVTSRGA